MVEARGGPLSFNTTSKRHASKIELKLGTLTWQSETIRYSDYPIALFPLPVASSISLNHPSLSPVAIDNVNCPLSLCTELDFSEAADQPLCPNALQCVLLVMPWPLPLRSLPHDPNSPHKPGFICTPIAQTAEEYLDYLWQQHQQGERLPPAVAQIWPHWKAGNERIEFDLDLIEDWWYLLLDAIVSEGYGGLCWLDEEEE